MKEKLVFPGSFLSFGEEYLPGKNAFENKNGNIYSCAVGNPVFDENQKVVNVNHKAKQVKLVDVGTIIFGRIDLVKENRAFVEILQAEHNGEQRKVSNISVVLPIFNVKNDYVKCLSDLFKIGDIIKARVESVTPFNIDLETKSGPSLGIVKGFCAKCRAPLRMLHNGFKCPKCATTAYRKFSSDYLVK